MVNKAAEGIVVRHVLDFEVSTLDGGILKDFIKTNLVPIWTLNLIIFALVVHHSIKCLLNFVRASPAGGGIVSSRFRTFSGDRGFP